MTPLKSLLELYDDEKINKQHNEKNIDSLLKVWIFPDFSFTLKNKFFYFDINMDFNYIL
jgi:hypothetical protein